MAAQRKPFGAEPSLPQVLVAILDGIGRAGVGEAELAGWIRKDPGIASELLASARVGSAVSRCHTIESAVVALGADSVRAMVLDVASRQFFSPYRPDQFVQLERIWRNALVAADFAQVVATLTRYRDPEQARICGLLLGLAPMELVAQGRPEYLARVAMEAEPEVLLEEQRSEFGTDQVEISIQKAKAWCPESFAADAMRYQFAPVEQVGDAHHLVKVVNLANRLAFPVGSGGGAVQAAASLFGLESDLTRELHQRLAGDVDRLASALGVPAHDENPQAPVSQAYRELGRRLDATARLAQARVALREASGSAALRAAVRTCARRVLNVEHSLLFQVDEQGRHLCAWLEGDDEPAFVLTLTSGRSLVADTLIGCSPRRGEGTVVIDRQLAGLLGSERLWCLPLIHQDKKLGVLVLGSPSPERDSANGVDSLAEALADEVASALGLHAVDKPAPGSGAGKADPGGWEELRFAVSTPLTVIHNHLEMLRTRMGDDGAAGEDLERIREETVRIEQILERTERPAIQSAVRGLALNDVVRDIVASLEASVLAPAGIRIAQDLDPEDPRLPERADALPTLLRQLLRHAAETLGAGSEVVISTRGGVNMNGCEHVELAVRENQAERPDGGSAPAPGPGSERQDHGHPGEWLGQVRELTGAMGGTMIFTMEQSSIRFQFLLPGRLPAGSKPGDRGVA